jgi:hypothetical protein
LGVEAGLQGQFDIFKLGLEGQSMEGGVGTGKNVSRPDVDKREIFACKLLIEEFVMLPTTSVMDELLGTCELIQSRTRARYKHSR